MSLFSLIFQKFLKVSYKVSGSFLLLMSNQVEVSNADILLIVINNSHVDYQCSLYC